MNTDRLNASPESRAFTSAQSTGLDAQDGSSPEQRPAKLARKRMGGYWQNAQNTYEQASLQSASNNASALAGRSVDQKLSVSSEIAPQTLLNLKSSSQSYKFAASHAGNLLVVRDVERLFVLDLANKPHVKQTLTATSEANIVQISDDGNLLVVMDANSTMEWWRLGRTVERAGSIKLEQAVSALALAPDNSLVAVAHRDSIELISLSVDHSADRNRLIPAPAVEHLEFARNGAVLLGTTLHAASAFTLAIHLPGLHTTTGSSANSRPSYDQSWLAQPFYPNAFPQHCLASLLPARHGRSSAWAFSIKERRFLELDLQSFHWNSAADTDMVSEAPSHLLPAVDASGEVVAVAGKREVYVFSTTSSNSHLAALGSAKNFIRISTPSDISSIFWINDYRKSKVQEQMSHRLVCTLSNDLLVTDIGLWQETDNYVSQLLNLDVPLSDLSPRSSGDKKITTPWHDDPPEDSSTQNKHNESEIGQQLDTQNGDTQDANTEVSMPPSTSKFDLMSQICHARETGNVTSVNGRPRVPRIILRDDADSAPRASTVDRGNTLITSQIHHHTPSKEDRQFTVFDPDDSPSKWSVDRRDGPLPVPVLRDQKFHYGTLPHVELDHDLAGHRSRQSLDRIASKSSDLMPKYIKHEDGVSQDRSGPPTLHERDPAWTKAHQRHLQAARSALSLQSDDRDPSGVSSVHELGFQEEQTRPGFPEMLAEDITRTQDGGEDSQDFDQFSGAHQAGQVLRESDLNRRAGRTNEDSEAIGPHQLSQQSSTSDLSEYGPEGITSRSHAGRARLRNDPQTRVTEGESTNSSHAQQGLHSAEQALYTPDPSVHTLSSGHDKFQTVEEGGSGRSRRSLRRVLSFNIAEKDSQSVANSVEREVSDMDGQYQLRSSGSFESATPIQAQRPYSKMILPLTDFPDLAANHTRTESYYSDTDQESSASNKFRVRRRPINPSSVYSAGSNVSDAVAADYQESPELERQAQARELDADIHPQSIETRVTPPETPSEDIHDYPTPPSTTQVDSLSRRLGSSTSGTRTLNNAAPKAALGAGRRIDNADALRSHPPDPNPPPPAQNDYRSYRSTFSHGTPLYTIPSMNSLKTLPKSDGRPSIEIADEPVPEIPQNYKTEAQIAASAAATGNGQSRDSEPQPGKPSKKNKRRSWDLLKRVGVSKSNEALSQMSSDEESKRRKTSSLRSKDSGDWVKSASAMGDASESIPPLQLLGTSHGHTAPVQPIDTARLVHQNNQRSRSSLRQRLSEDWADYRRGTPDSTAHSIERRQEGLSETPSVVDHLEQARPQRTTSRLQKRRSGSSSRRGNSNIRSAVVDDLTMPGEQEALHSRTSNLRQRVSDLLSSGRNSISDTNDVAPDDHEGRSHENTASRRPRAPSFRQRLSADWATYTSTPQEDGRRVVADTRTMHCGGIVNNGALSQAPEQTRVSANDVRPARKHRISGVWTRDRSTTPSTENLDRSSTNGESSSMTAPTTVTEGMTTAEAIKYGERSTQPRSSSRLSTASTARRVSENIAARNRTVAPHSGPFASQYADARDSEESTRNEHGDWAMGRHMSSAGSRPQLASIKRLSGSFNDWARTRTARGATFNYAAESSNASQVDREEIMMSGGSGAEYGAPTDIDAATGGDTTARVVEPLAGLQPRASRASSRAGSIIRRFSGTDWTGGPRQKASGASMQGSVFGGQQSGTRTSEDSVDEGADWAMGRHFRTASTTASRPASRRTSGIFRGRSTLQSQQLTGQVPSNTVASSDGAADGVQRRAPARAPSEQGSVFGRASASARVSEDSVDEGADWAFSRHMRNARPASNSSRTSAIFGQRKSRFGRKTSHDLGNAEATGTGLGGILRDDEAGTAGATAAAATAMEHYPDSTAAEHNSATAPMSTTKSSDRLHGSMRRGAAGTNSMREEERPQEATISKRSRGRSSFRDGERRCVVM